MKRGRTENWNLEYSDNLSDCGEMLNFDSREQIDGNFNQSKDTLQSLVQSCICGQYNQDQISECKHVSTRQDKLNFEDFKNLSNYPLLSFNENLKVEDDQYIKFQQEKQPTISSQGTNLIVSVNVVSKKAEKTKKTRIRWNKDLHNKFMESINHLGGAKKATPKEILKLMNCEGLTIFHIKSHLQKYRVAPPMQESSEGSTCNAFGNSEHLDSNTGKQIVEALRLQLDVQKRLCEQLESQKKLQVHIEEQTKQLQNMIQSQQKTT